MGAKEIYVDKQPAPLEIAVKMAKLAEKEPDIEKKKALQAQLSEQVCHKLSGAELDNAAKLAQPSLLRDMATFAIAENAYDAGLINEARVLFRNYIHNYPFGYFAEEAQVLAGKINAMVKPEPVLGVSLPLTGRFKEYGERVRKAMDIALDELGDDAPELFIVNSNGEADAARNTSLRLQKKGVLAVVGDIVFEATLGLKENIERFGIDIVPLCAPDLPGKSTSVIRFLPGPAKEAELLIGQPYSKSERYALLVSNDAVHLRKRDAVVREIGKRGGRVVKQLILAPGQTTFTDEAKALAGRGDLSKNKTYKECLANNSKKKNARQISEFCKAKVPPVIGFDTLIFITDATVIRLSLPAMVAEDIPLSAPVTSAMAGRPGFESIKSIRVLGFKEMAEVSVQKTAPELLEGAIVLGSQVPLVEAPRMTEFKKRFAERGGGLPGLSEMAAHDALLTLGTLMSKEVFQDREQFRKRLEDFAPVAGVLGYIGPVRDGAFVLRTPLFIYSDGQLKPLVEPAELREDSETEPAPESEPESEPGDEPNSDAQEGGPATDEEKGSDEKRETNQREEDDDEEIGKRVDQKQRSKTKPPSKK
jgi:hypothetical protein